MDVWQTAYRVIIVIVGFSAGCRRKPRWDASQWSLNIAQKSYGHAGSIRGFSHLPPTAVKSAEIQRSVTRPLS